MSKGKTDAAINKLVDLASGYEDDGVGVVVSLASNTTLSNSSYSKSVTLNEIPEHFQHIRVRVYTTTHYAERIYAGRTFAGTINNAYATCQDLFRVNGTNYYLSRLFTAENKVTLSLESAPSITLYINISGLCRVSGG